MSIYWLIISTLCVWRITHLLQAEDGPWKIIINLRRLAGEGFFGDLLDCFYCLSLWISLPFALLTGDTVMERIMLWPALSAGAILLERVVDKEPPPAPYIEDKEI